MSFMVHNIEILLLKMLPWHDMAGCTISSRADFAFLILWRINVGITQT